VTEPLNPAWEHGAAASYDRLARAHTMKIVALIARILLGLVFFAFGLIAFLPFVPKGRCPPGLAGQFVTALIQSHYGLVVSALQIVGGALSARESLRSAGAHNSRPIIVNIFLYHLCCSTWVWVSRPSL